MLSILLLGTICVIIGFVGGALTSAWASRKVDTAVADAQVPEPNVREQIERAIERVKADGANGSLDPWGIPLYESPLVPKGQAFLMSYDDLDALKKREAQFREMHPTWRND